MPFTSHYFEITKSFIGGVNPIIPVDYIPLTTSGNWRTAGQIRAWLRLLPRLLLFDLFVWIWTHLLALFLRLFRSREEVRIILHRLSGRKWILRLSLKFFAKLGLHPLWKVFWTVYFVYGDPDDFLDNYLEAWKQRCEGEQKVYLTTSDQPSALPSISRCQCSIVMYIDNRRPLHIPCRWGMTDREFIIHISQIYYLRKSVRGIIPSWSFRDLSVVEIAELDHQNEIGPQIEYLKLGRYESENSIIHHFLDPYSLQGDDLVQDLIRKKVIASVAGTTTPAVVTPLTLSRSALLSRPGTSQFQATTSPIGSPPPTALGYLGIEPKRTIQVGGVLTPFAKAEEEVTSSEKHLNPGAASSTSDLSRPNSALRIPDTPSHAGSAFEAFGVHHGALNLISKWETDSIGSIVAVPIFMSLLFTIVWPIVAVIAFNADAQYSVQTAFLIAIYILIACAILMVLVAFLDTREERLDEKKRPR